MFDNIFENFIGYRPEKRAEALSILIKSCESIDFSKPNYDDENVRVSIALFEHMSGGERQLITPILRKLSEHANAPQCLKSFFIQEC